MSGMQEERRAASVAILETTSKRSFNEETQAAKYGVQVRKNTKKKTLSALGEEEIPLFIRYLIKYTPTLHILG